MKRILIVFYLIITFLMLSNCGYKVLDDTKTNRFSIKEISTSGDKRINFKIKNSLIIDTTNNIANSLIIELDTKKTKNVKEKNIKNEIIKYEVSVISNFKINLLERRKEYTFSVSSNGDYLAADKYSTTLRNEKRLMESLTNDLIDKIKKQINLITNDL